MPDGQSVVSANDAGTVQRVFLDGRADQPPPLAESDYGYNAVAVSRDGRYVLTGNADKSITAYAVDTGERVLGPVQTVHSNHLVDLSFSIDGTSFAAVDTDGFANLHAFPSGEQIDAPFNFSGRTGILFFHPDGERLFGGDSSGRLKQWSMDDARLAITSAPGHSQTPVASSLSADGSVLVTLGRDQIVRFWTLDERFPYLAGADKSGQVQIWRTATADRPINLRGHLAGVWALAYSENDEVLTSADRAGQIKLWNATNGALLQETAVPDQSVWALAFARGDRTLLVGADSGVLSYSVDEGVWGDPLLLTRGQLTRLALSTDRSRLATSDSMGNIAVIDVATGEVVLDIAGDNETVWSVADAGSHRRHTCGHQRR